jgi:hypothetical protein
MKLVYKYLPTDYKDIRRSQLLPDPQPVTFYRPVVVMRYLKEKFECFFFM